nr:hypothetical protein [Candidatus Freyarchaeota archaeon]
MASSDSELSEESFVEIFEYLERLKPLAELAREFHIKGLNRDELKRLISLLKEVIENSTKRSDLPILATLEWFRQNINEFLLPDSRFSPRKLRELLPPVPLLPIVSDLQEITQLLGALFSSLTPFPSPTLRGLVDEFDTLIEGFTSDLTRYTKILVEFFKVAKPESIPWIIKLIEKNPGHARSTLGEPLCIWWFGMVLSELKPVWKGAIGPFIVNDVDIDVLSVNSSNKEFSVAEVKVSKLRDELSKACDQAAARAKMFMNLDTLRKVFKWVKEPCNPIEVSIITPYNISDYKDEIKSELKTSLKKESVDEKYASVYDVNDILDALSVWRSKAKERYKELFHTFNKILEST